MSNPFTFEFDELEMPESIEDTESCDCPKCRAKRQNEELEQDEAWDELSLEEEFADEVPLLRKAGPIVAAKAQQVGATAKQQIAAGSTAEKTCWMQNVLNKAAGEALAVDGIFGPPTRGAVVRFQSSQGLQVDGIVGPQTETALIQAALNEIAKASLLPVNGVKDARTQQEIRRFQSQRGLAVDGIVGPLTRGAMIDALGGRRCAARPAPRPRPPTPQPPPTPQRPTPPPRPGVPTPPGCDRAELARRVDACIAETKRCAIQAGEDLALALAGCKLSPFCNAVAVGKGLLALRRCREALLRCDAAAKAATNCT